MTANESKSYLGYLNRLVDLYKNTYHHSIGKRAAINADCSAFTEETESSHKVPKFKVGDRVRIRGILTTRISLAKVTPKIG